MTPEFHIEEATTPHGTCILRVHGRLDARSATTLTRHCAGIRGAGRSAVLNLAGVTFVASSGIGTLLALVEEFRQSKQALRLAALSPAVDSVVRLLQLDPFLQPDASEPDAVAALESQAPRDRAA
jgi:anti-anti-sigma factor